MPTALSETIQPIFVIANNYSDLNGNLKLMYRMKGQQYVDRNELYKLICGFKYDLIPSRAICVPCGQRLSKGPQ